MNQYLLFLPENLPNATDVPIMQTNAPNTHAPTVAVGSPMMLLLSHYLSRLFFSQSNSEIMVDINIMML